MWMVCLSRLFSSIYLFSTIFECSCDWNRFSACMLSEDWLGINFLTCLLSSSKALGVRLVSSRFTRLRFGYVFSVGLLNLTLLLGFADPILFFYPGWSFILIWIESNLVVISDANQAQFAILGSIVQSLLSLLLSMTPWISISELSSW